MHRSCTCWQTTDIIKNCI